MQRRLLLNVVIAQCPAVFQLLPGKDQTLLIRWNAFLILNLAFDIIYRVAGLDFQCDGLSGEGLDEDLHPASEPKDKVECALLLDIVV